MKHEDLGVSRETAERLEGFVALLHRWNGAINLVAERELANVWQRHIADSLQLAPLLPPADGALVDLGSGGGFPGLVLAVATGREAHLVEADRRKATFLMEAGRVLGLTRVHVHAVRIEAAQLPAATILTARALAPLSILLGYAYRILAPSGIAVFPKGRTAAEELTAATRDWTMRVEQFPSRTDSSATIFRISEIHPVGDHA